MWVTSIDEAFAPRASGELAAPQREALQIERATRAQRAAVRFGGDERLREVSFRACLIPRCEGGVGDHGYDTGTCDPPYGRPVLRDDGTERRQCGKGEQQDGGGPVSSHWPGVGPD